MLSDKTKCVHLHTERQFTPLGPTSWWEKYSKVLTLLAAWGPNQPTGAQAATARYMEPPGHSLVQSIGNVENYSLGECEICLGNRN